jgi:CO dehydrogenase/acetyl-CoA synthase beta subunit
LARLKQVNGENVKPHFPIFKPQKIKKMKKNQLIEQWTKTAKEVLEGRTIKEVRYLNDEEMKMMGWYKRPICFFLDNGESCILSCDDEGNDGGVLFYGRDGVLPVI